MRISDWSSDVCSSDLLARALMFISRADAASYFERGVEIVDRVGDEMHDRLSAMLGLARAAGAGAEERAEEAVRVARIAEIYEDINNHKFPWIDVGGGVRALGKDRKRGG